MQQNKAVLLLEDGTLMFGKAFGKPGTATGEICFNTGMTGYQEVFTDPSYYGQVLIMNMVHTGNYGIRHTDVESASAKVKAVIGRNLEAQYSRFLAEGSLQDYLYEQGVVAIDAVDTRALVAHIRNRGAMNCIVSSEITDIPVLEKLLSEVPSMNGLELASVVSTTETYDLGDEGSAIRIAVLDFGVKKISCNAWSNVAPMFGSFMLKRVLMIWKNSGQQVISSVMVPVIPPRWIMPFKRSNRYRLPANPFSGSALVTSCWHWQTISAPLKCTMVTVASTTRSRT